MVCLAAVSLAVGCGAPITATAPPVPSTPSVHLVKDIVIGPDPAFPEASSAQLLVVSGGVLFLAADDGAHGLELWSSDGTEAGTVQVKDIVPGSEGSSPILGVDVHGALFFVADDGAHGQELWKSDGSEAGTVMVKDVAAGSGGSSPGALTAWSDALLFAADDGIHGLELWKSDGTETGTEMVSDIRPGPEGSSPTRLIDALGTLFLAADDGTHGRELWMTDGTDSGTVMVRDIAPGAGSSAPRAGTVVGNGLMFSADDGTHGRELWMSDGTRSGTRMLMDIWPGPRSSSPGIGGVANMMVFAADDGVHGREPWKTYGTTGTTSMVEDIHRGPEGSDPRSPLAFPGMVVFTADDGEHGRELWRADSIDAPIPTTTAMVSDLLPGAAGSSPGSPTPVAGEPVFVADDGTHGPEIWASDGTRAGTVLAADILEGSTGSDPASLTAEGRRLFFLADDGTHGRELWVREAAFETAVLQAGNDLPRASITTSALPLPTGSGIGDYFRPFDGRRPCPLVFSDIVLGKVEAVRPSWVRLEIDPNEWVGIQSPWDFSRFRVNACQDEVVSTLAEMTDTLVLTIVYWDEELHAERPPDYAREAEVERYLEYARFIVRHFGDRVRYFEILNEAIVYVDLPDYLALVRRAVRIIREEAPEAQIVIDGTANLLYQNEQDYLFGILRSNVMPLIDAIATHPMYGASPEYDDTLQYYEGYPSLVRRIEDVAEAHGFSGEYLTEEMLWRTAENAQGDQPWVYTPAASTKYRLRAIVLHRGEGWWAGIQGGTYTTTPSSMLVLRDLGTILDRAEPETLDVRIETQGSDVLSYGFALPDGDRMLALWTNGVAVDDDPGVQATLTFSGSSATRAIGIDVLEGFQQELIATHQGADLLIEGLLLKDYPVFVRLEV
jgi:ELWxxDGT repeat protein